jgi:hypothetical protein
MFVLILQCSKTKAHVTFASSVDYREETVCDYNGDAVLFFY